VARQEQDRTQQRLIRRGTLGAAIGSATALLAAALIHALFVEPLRVTRTELPVPVPGLPESFEGYTILHISDFEAIHRRLPVRFLSPPEAAVLRLTSVPTAQDEEDEP
jgi:predicted MPP superfamily phosphohydrolase